MATWDVMMVDDGLGWTVPASGTTAGSVYASDSWGGGIQAVEPPVLSMHQTAGGCLQAVQPLAVSLHQTAGGGMIAVQPTAGMTHCLCHSPPSHRMGRPWKAHNAFSGWHPSPKHCPLMFDGHASLPTHSDRNGWPSIPLDVLLCGVHHPERGSQPSRRCCNCSATHSLANLMAFCSVPASLNLIA